MADRTRNEQLLSIDAQIRDELQSLGKNIDLLSDTELTRDNYVQYQHRLSQVQGLFDKSSDIMRDIAFNQSNPDLYSVLESKERINSSYGAFRRLQNKLTHLFEKGQNRENEGMERPFAASIPEEEPDRISEEEFPIEEPESEEFDEALLAAELEEVAEEEEKKAAKRKAEKDRQARFAKEGRDAERREQERYAAEQRARQEENYRRTQQEQHTYNPSDSRYFYPPAQDHYQAPPVAPYPQQPQNPTFESPSDRFYNEPPKPVPHDSGFPYETPSGKQFSAADKRDERYREEDERQARARRETETRDRYHETMARYRERMDQSTQISLDQTKSHFDFSVLNGESGAAQSPQVFHFVPGGVAESEVRQRFSSSYIHDSTTAASDNSRIYSAIRSSNQDGGQPHSVSPAYESQMRFNLETARLHYAEKRGTPEALQATQAYNAQRQAYMAFQRDIREGRIQVERPNVMETSAASRQPYERSGSPSTQYFYTPGGVTGHSVENAQFTGSTYNVLTKDRIYGPRYTEANPLVVNPAYEEALKARAERATVAVDHAVVTSRYRGETVRVNPFVNNEVKYATNAYIAFQRAKQQGEVLVNSTSDRHTPDFDYWSHQYNTNTNGNRQRKNQADGTTVQTKGPNPNKINKESIKVDKTVLGKSVTLKREGVISRYSRAIGYKVEGYGTMAIGRASRKLYHMMQNGDEDGPSSLRTFEQGRYYLSTGVGIAGAVKNFHVVNSSSSLKAGAKAEAHRFGKYAHMDKKELSSQIHENLKNNRAVKKEIKELWAKGSALTAEERAELIKKMREHASSSLEARQAVGYRNLQTKNANAVKAAQDLESRRHVITTRKQVDKAISELRREQEQKMAKKFGKKMMATDKSIGQKIDLMKKQGREMKAQIKAMQAKGSALSTSERKQLLKLMEKHKKHNELMKKYTGLRDARRNLNESLKPYMEMRKRIIKNANAWTSGLYALHGFVLKPIREGSENGAQGLAKAADVASNRYVRLLIKKTWKATMGSAHWLAKKTGLEKAAKKAANTTKRAVVNSKPVKLVSAEAEKAKIGIRTAVDRTKAAASRMTPNFIKTAVNKHAQWKVARKEAMRALRNRFGNSAFGRAISAVYRGSSRLVSAARAALSFLKGFAIKGGLAVLASILIIGIIAGFVEIIASSASSLVLSPDSTEDGKIDLTSYVSVLRTEQEDFDAEIAELQNDPAYDEVNIHHMTNTMDNTKEMLSMMAVFFSQDLDMDKNPKVKTYLESIFWDSHYYTSKETEYDCSGCKTRTVSDGHSASCPDDCTDSHTSTEKYCPGHLKLDIYITILGFDDIFTADTMGNAMGTIKNGELIGRMKISYYCLEDYSHICNDGSADTTAIGTKPKAQHTIAVDPAVIPLGSHVIIDGKEYVAEDTGGHIKGNRIDIAVKKHDQAIEKGVRYNIPVYSVAYEGDGIQDSGEWLGWTEENIEWCKNIYSQNWSSIYGGISDYGGFIESGELVVEGDFTWPVTNTTTSSGYGWRTHPVTGQRKFHKGTDIAVPVGTPVHAAADGTVIQSYYSDSAGNMIVIDHGNGIMTKYFHNSELHVNAGDTVKAGDIISLSGNTGISTGPHLHFEFWVNGNPIDPRAQYKLN